MARISVEQKALTDPRYAVLGRLLGTSRREALGYMIEVWNECQERETYYLSDTILDGIFGRETSGHLLGESELARRTETKGWYICGTKGRVEWLKKRRQEGKKGGKLGGRPRKPLGKPLGVDGKQQRETPPAPAPAPAFPPETSSPSGEKPDSFAVRADADAKPPAVLTFPTSGVPSMWALTQAQLDKWTQLYPGVDVLAEARRALAWVEANGRKTARGMPAFLVRWLNRSNDRRGAIAPRRPSLAERNRLALAGWGEDAQ